MTPRYGHVYLADLNPRFGTESGKIRPVVVVQTDALNPYHLSTLICPLTTQIDDVETPLRVALPKGVSGLSTASDILVDQIKAIDNQRFRRTLGALSEVYLNELRHKLLLILDFVEEAHSQHEP